MTIAVLGTPCGGTGYAHALLRAHGLDVGHEEWRADGIVCGFASLSTRRPGARPERVRPSPVDARRADVVVRLIRDPLDVAVTLPGVMGMGTHALCEAAREIKRAREWQRSGDYARPQVPDGRGGMRTAAWYEAAPVLRAPIAPSHRADDLVRLALRYWVEAHEAIPARAPVLRLASIHEDFAERVAPLLGIDKPLRLKIQPRSKGRRWPRWTWERWAAEDPAYAARGRALWERHGGASDAGRGAR